jgi:dihydrofolate reductase
LKFSSFIANSIDGFIARTNGDIKWLHEASAGVDMEEDYGPQHLELVASFDNWLYGSTPVLILSSMMVALPKKTPETVTKINGEISEAIEKAENADNKLIYGDGGKTIHSFFQEGVLNDIILTTIPILLGEGIPLFGRLENPSFIGA